MRLCHCFCCFSDLLTPQPSVLVQLLKTFKTFKNRQASVLVQLLKTFKTFKNRQPSVLLQLLQAERPSAGPTLQRLHQTGGRHVQVVMMKINQN